MENVDISTLAVSKILTSDDSSNLQENVSNVNGDIYIADLTYPKQGLAFNNVKYYGSKTEFKQEGSYMVVRTDGDPYPSKAGASKGYIGSTPSNDIGTPRTWYDDPNPLVEQSSVYKFIYRGGTSAPLTDQSQTLVSSGGINGIFNNGAAFLSPMGGNSLPDVTMISKATYYVNAYYFINFLGKDLAGHPEEGGEYHYHIGTFLYNMWNNSTFYNSISYYSGSSYSLVGKTVTYSKTVFSDANSGNSDHMRHSTGHSKIVGFCFDGYPIYGPFGYTNATDETGGVALMTSSYRLKTSDNDRPYKYTDYIDLTSFINVAPSLLGHAHSYYNKTNDPNQGRILMGPGAYTNDYEYVSGLGTLDYYNGRYTKTPDYPNGTYAYFITLDNNGIPQYPYVVGNSSIQQRTFTETTSVYCTISSSVNNITSGTATITFTMSKVTTNFTIDDITLSGNGTSNGSLTNFIATSPTVYTATYTPPSNTTSAISITVAAGTFTDADGNSNYVSNTLSLTVNTVVVAGNSSAHTMIYLSNAEHVNALMIDFTSYAGAIFKWTTSDAYDGTYVDDVLVNGTVNTTQFHHIVASSDSSKFIKAQIKNAADTNYNTVAIIYVYNDGYIGVALDESVTSIAKGAFVLGAGTYSASENVYKIKNIFIPKSVTKIDNDAFSGYTDNVYNNFIGKIYIEAGSTYTATSNVFPSTCSVVENASLSDITSQFVPSKTTVSNSPIVGASVYYVGNDGNKLSNSPTGTTDQYGEVVINTMVTDSVTGGTIDFSKEPFKITGGANSLTGQSISYWYAKAGTKTITPITNLLFYCSASGSLTNSDITRSIGIDTSHDFSNYNYYKVMVQTTNQTSNTYYDALKANNLGNAINVFATVSTYFLKGISNSTIDIEYDAMMRSIANISTNNNGVNEFTQLFGTDLTACTNMVKDRIQNRISALNISQFSNTHQTNILNAISAQIASLITSIMSSPDKVTTDMYELKGYNVTSSVQTLTSTLANNYGSSSDKTTLVNTYVTNLGYIFSPSSNICFPAGTPVFTNHGYVPIEQIDPVIHTVRNKPIVAITKTVSDEKYLIRIAKHALGNNYPSKTTLISQNHQVMFMGHMIKAKDLVELVDKVTQVPYNGEPLYNVLLETHDKMQVNNLIVETLHPEHKIAQLYKLLNMVKPEEREQMIALYNQFEYQHKQSLTK